MVIVCANCGADSVKKARDIRRRIRERGQTLFFCSHACANHHITSRSEFKAKVAQQMTGVTGPDHPAWRHGMTRAEESRRYRDEHPERYAAQMAVNHAIRDGEVVRGDVCADCGREGYCQGHHEDYGQPLEVVWLCSTCHIQRHTMLRTANG